MSELSAVLTSTEESVASTIATVATTLEQLKSKLRSSVSFGTGDEVGVLQDSSYSNGQDVTPEYPRATHVPNE